MMNRITILKCLLAAGLGLTLACSIVGIQCYSTIQSQGTEVIAKRLDTILDQFELLHQEVKKPAEAANLSVINQDFNKLAELIEQLKSNDATTFNHLINENRAELTSKLDSLHELVTALDNKQHPIKYLPVTSLPFKVISIDSIQQVSVATVAYNFKTIPLEKSDKLAGWIVLRIDFGLQRLELENSNQERVVVKMHGVEGDFDV